MDPLMSETMRITGC